MTAEIFTEADFVARANPGVVSLQLLPPLNSAQAPFTITRVSVEPGAAQPRHLHEAAA